MASEQELILKIKAMLDGKGFDDLKAKTQDAEKSTSSLGKMFQSLLPALSAVAVVAAFKSITDSAIESERESRILAQTIKNLGLENQVTTKEVEKFAMGLANLAGVNDEEVTRSFNQMIRTTKDAKQAFELVKIATEMASGSGRSLAETSQVLEMALLGNTRGLKQFGIQAKENESTVQLLTRVTKLYSGQTEELGKTTEGAMKKSAQAFDQLKEAAGRAFLPILGWGANVTRFFIELSEITIKQAIISFQKLGNIISGIYQTIITRDMKKFKEAIAENHKLETEAVKQTAEYVNNQNKESTDIKVNLKALETFHTQKELDAQEKAETKTAEAIKKIREQSGKDFLSGVRGQYDIITEVTNKFSEDIGKGLSKTFSGMEKPLADIGLSVGGIFGGVAGLVVAGFTSLFGQQKSFAQMVKESYDEMVKKTNEKIDEIGRKKTEAEKRLELLDVIKPESGLLLGSTARLLGVEEMTYEQAKLKLTKELLATQEEQLEFSKSNLEELKTQKTGLEAEYAKAKMEFESRPSWKVLSEAEKLMYYSSQEQRQAKISAAGKYISEIEAGQTINELDLLKEIVSSRKELGLSFASGGVVPGRPGQPQLAMVHGGETITPAGQAGVSITIQVGAFMGNESDAMMFARMVEKYTQKIGRRNLTV